MSFESDIPKHLKTLSKQKQDRLWEQRQLEHDCDCDCDCDCEFCDMKGIPEEYQDEYDELERDITAINKIIESIQHHAKMHGITVS